MALLADVGRGLRQRPGGSRRDAIRAAFVSALTRLAEEDSRIILLTADLGYAALEPMAERFPDQFINVGVGEQNMLGLATGMAEAGFIPYVYSIVTFATMRAYEFFRNGAIVHGLPVRLVGIGGGVEYGHNGISHFGLEDVGIMRVQPDLTVLAPADARQTDTMMRATWDLPGPVYIRLGKDDRTTVPGLEGRFRLGHAETVREGSGVLLISMGAISSVTAAAADELAAQETPCTHVVVSSLNPAPTADLVDALSRHRVAVTVESHYVVGGLGSLVAEVIADHGVRTRLVRCGVQATPNLVSGSQAAMERANGLSAAQISARVLDTLTGR